MQLLYIKNNFNSFLIIYKIFIYKINKKFYFIIIKYIEYYYKKI